MEYISMTIARYQELIRKEMAFDVRQAELREASFVSTADRILFKVDEVQKPEDDDF